MSQPVLLVLPGPSDRPRLEHMLGSVRAHLVFVEPAPDLARRVAEIRPDVVIVSGNLEGAVTRVRSAPLGEELPIVAFGPDPVQGADDTLFEPLERDALLQAVGLRVLVGREELEDTAAPQTAPPLDAQTVVGFQSPFLPADVSIPVEELPFRAEPPTSVGSKTPPPPPPLAPPPRPAAQTGPGPQPSSGPTRAIDADPESGTDSRVSVAAAGTDPAVEVAPSELPSDLVRTRPVSKVGAPRRSLDESQLGQRLIKRIHALHSALGEVDYYQLLGVEAGADDARIHQAWLDLSLELHPDRFFLLRSVDLKEKLYAIYRQVTEAHRVLADPEARAEYDRARLVRGPRSSPVPRSDGPSSTAPGALGLVAHAPSAKPFVERAERAFSSGRMQDARLYVHAVLACEEDNASARVALARVEEHLGPTV